MKNLRGLAILLTLAIGAGSGGCASNDLIEPLCLPDWPALEDITLAEQMDIRAYVGKDVLRKVVHNDTKQQNYIELVDDLVYAHNEQFEATCDIE